MTIEESISAALAAQLAPMKTTVDRLTAEIESLRRALPPQLLMPAEAAKILRVSLSTIRRRMKNGQLPVDRSSGQPRIDLAALRPANETDVERVVFEIKQGGRQDG